MQKILILTMLLLMMMGVNAVESGFKGRPIENNVLMPTGYTLNEGEFTLGLGSVTYGLTDRFQMGTNVLFFLFQDFNANLKYSFFKGHDHALAVGLEFHRLDLSVFDSDVAFTSLVPFLSYSTRIGMKTMLHAGAQYSYFSGDADIDDAEISITAKGSSVSLGLEHSLSNRTKLLADSCYDLTFNGFNVGTAVLFGWKSFRLKMGINYVMAQDSNNYVMPVIGLWWRFNG